MYTRTKDHMSEGQPFTETPDQLLSSFRAELQHERSSVLQGSPNQANVAQWLESWCANLVGQVRSWQSRLNQLN